MPHRVAELLRKAQQVRRLARLIISDDFKESAEQLAREYEQAAQQIGQTVPSDFQSHEVGSETDPSQNT